MLLTDLPPELLEEIFLQCDPCDVGALAQCCSYFHTIIYAPENPSASMPFWRALYLQQPLDDPRLSLTQLGLPRAISDDLWKTRLQRLARAQAVLEGRATVRLDELESILESILDMITFVVPLRTYAALDVSSSLILATLLSAFALTSALAVPDREVTTHKLVPINLTPADPLDTQYLIFDTFEADAGRQTHLNGPIAAALMGKKDELLSAQEGVAIKPIQLIAHKIAKPASATGVTQSLKTGVRVLFTAKPDKKEEARKHLAVRDSTLQGYLFFHNKKLTYLLHTVHRGASS